MRNKLLRMYCTVFHDCKCYIASDHSGRSSMEKSRPQHRGKTKPNQRGKSEPKHHGKSPWEIGAEATFSRAEAQWEKVA